MLQQWSLKVVLILITGARMWEAEKGYCLMFLAESRIFKSCLTSFSNEGAQFKNDH